MRYLLLLLVCCSFFWEDEEKEIKSLAQVGEHALHMEDFGAAKVAYDALFKKLEGERGFLSWVSYIDYHLHYVRTLEALKEFDEAQKLLDNLMAQKPPNEMLPKVRLTQARLTATHSSPEKSFLEMSKIASFLPMARWSREDLSFYRALCYSLDEHFDTLLQKARRLFVTNHYEEAKGIYEEILAAISGGYFPKASLNKDLIEKKVRYCLAECHYSLTEYEKTLSLINTEGDGQIDREMIYLMALCYQKKQEYEQAINCFQQYAGHQGQHFDHALFELGFYAYKHGNNAKAKTYFQQLQTLQMNGKPKFVGALYLGRILLQENAPDQVEQLLTRFSPDTMKDDPLKYEFYYLLGEAAFIKEHYESAKEMYLASLPQTIGCEWGLQARTKLGWCYIKLGELEKGEKVFKTLLLSNERTQATFALAHLYLMQGGKGVEQAIEELFSKEDYALDKEHEALLLRAQAACGYDKTRRLYLEATSQIYQDLPTYADAWYQLGLSEFQKGLKNPDVGSLFFERATLAFQEAFALCKNQKLASEILKLEAKANFYRDCSTSSLALLEQLLEQFIETCDEHEETLYLRGLVASKISDEAHFCLAENSLKQVLLLYPGGMYCSDALFTLGTLYFQNDHFENAYETFFNLSSTYPHAEHASDALFWAAESLEKINDQDSRIVLLRKSVYEKHPTSKQAAEAFFRLYPYSAYVDGIPEAIEHLTHFPSFFPNSPIAVTAHYLVAVNEQDFTKAEHGLSSAIHQFHRSINEGKTPDLSTIHFYYEAQHKLAVLYLNEHKDEEKALNLLKRIIEDFKEKNHPLTSLITDNRLYDQAQYSLAKGYLQLGQKTKAEQIFLSMLKYFRERSEDVGLYLSLTWKEQGKLAMECYDLDTALRCLNFADDAGNYFLSDDQKLNIWLLKSECYKRQKDFGNSMRMLSKVINADMTSPLRIKAMYLRAEIYELQGRPELVVRQLEAISKKGGEWAIVAKEKLKADYGIQ